MDYIVLIFSSALAGIGTGLVGLSAATVMVPLLIVLTDTFGIGENGVYEATTIALASDILGSLFTTIIYAKNKNIDIKRGAIMFICIISMCAIGSYVAFLVGNNVLGGFSLILTFCIGLRFLFDNNKEKKKKKIPKYMEIIISIFFGLCIGFGTGFVGTGGGMMMLVVFTMFLNFDLKKAVGTSTLIMTFTALIASISHICINPSILTNNLSFLIIGIIVATFFSIISAIFANKVNEVKVKKITGILLTILGITLIYINYFLI